MTPSSRASFSTGGPDSGCGPMSALLAGWTEIRESVTVWRERQARRRAALTIDDHTLADIGLIRAQIDHEAAKPFWRR